MDKSKIHEIQNFIYEKLETHEAKKIIGNDTKVIYIDTGIVIETPEGTVSIEVTSV